MERDRSHTHTGFGRDASVGYFKTLAASLPLPPYELLLRVLGSHATNDGVSKLRRHPDRATSTRRGYRGCICTILYTHTPSLPARSTVFSVIEIRAPSLN